MYFAEKNISLIERDSSSDRQCWRHSRWPLRDPFFLLFFFTFKATILGPPLSLSEVQSKTRKWNDMRLNDPKRKSMIGKARERDSDDHVTVWPDGKVIFSIFGHLQYWTFAQYHMEFAKFCQSHLKICPSGEISPNLVTLLCGDVSLRLGGWVSVYEVVHLSMRKGVHSYVRTSVTRSGNLLDFDQL